MKRPQLPQIPPTDPTDLSDGSDGTLRSTAPTDSKDYTADNIPTVKPKKDPIDSHKGSGISSIN